MKFQTGDLVKIQKSYADGDGSEFDWIGMIVSHRGAGGYDDEYEEYVVMWAHNLSPTHEYGYYLEVINE